MNIWLLSLLFLYGCTTSHHHTHFKGIAMTIPYCVQIADPLSESQSTAIEETILSTFNEIHTIYNNWNPDSEISRLNRLPSDEKIAISPSLNAFLASIDSIVQFTEGRFDPTVDPLQLLWKQCLKEGRKPPPQQLTLLESAVGWKKIHIENGLFWKECSETAIDFGGIAKGYAVDLIVQRLQTKGFTNFYVEWGGEIATRGLRSDKNPWKIGIEGLSSIDLVDCAIATSGSYVQNWSVNGINYTHIIDPDSKQPLQNTSISSVSVLASTCSEADALATAFMLFPSKEAATKWAQEKNIQIFIW